MWQISYPPANGASQGNYFLPKSHKKTVFFNSMQLVDQGRPWSRLTPALRRSISRRNVICNECVMITEIWTIEDGQKDALLWRPTFKKNI